jgi:DNA-directed RNA polymerase beta' subunit
MLINRCPNVNNVLIVVCLLRADYQQLVYAGLGKHCVGRTKLLPPAIIKPVPLWSGKQIFSTIIINLTPKGKPLINIESKAKISVNDWQNGTAKEKEKWEARGIFLPDKINEELMTESEVVIRQGELLVGVLDKVSRVNFSTKLMTHSNEFHLLSNRITTAALPTA